VTIDKERVLWQSWTEIKLWRYWGWWFVRTLYVRERSLYLMCSFILNQCRNLRTGVMWEDFGVLVTAQAREFWMFWSLFIWDWKIIVQWVAVVKFRMNDRSGDGTGSFEFDVTCLPIQPQMFVGGWMWKFGLESQFKTICFPNGNLKTNLESICDVSRPLRIWCSLVYRTACTWVTRLSPQN